MINKNVIYNKKNELDYISTTNDKNQFHNSLGPSIISYGSKGVVIQILFCINSNYHNTKGPAIREIYNANSGYLVPGCGTSPTAGKTGEIYNDNSSYLVQYWIDNKLLKMVKTNDELYRYLKFFNIS